MASSVARIASDVSDNAIGFVVDIKKKFLSLSSPDDAEFLRGWKIYDASESVYAKRKEHVLKDAHGKPIYDALGAKTYTRPRFKQQVFLRAVSPNETQELYLRARFDGFSITKKANNSSLC